MTDSYEDMIVNDAMKRLVTGVIRKQFRISWMWGDDYISDPFSKSLHPEQYKKIRRGVRWILSNAGFDCMTDAELIEILNKLGFDKIDLFNVMTDMQKRTNSKW
jgi:hypothetical protein